MNENLPLTVAMQKCPLVAILRGVRPNEVVAIADVLVDCGFTMIEVPLNSPDPFASIAAIADRYDSSILVGAGTVLTSGQVAEVGAAGGTLVVSPNTDSTVIAAAVERGMIALPGYATPSEAFAAIAAGAHGLKLFPAEAASPKVVKAHRAVLPPAIPLLVVGGVQPGTMQPWMDAGANGFGLGSGLYSPGLSEKEVAVRARQYLSGLLKTS